MKKGTLWACLLIASASMTELVSAQEFKSNAAKAVALRQESNADVKSTPTTTYYVRKFDTDWMIASKFRTTTTFLKVLNPGVDFSSLDEGTALVVPTNGKGEVLASTTTKDSFKVKDPARTPDKQVTKVMKITGDNVRVRTQPSTSGKSVDMVDRGTTGKVLEYRDGWYKLDFSNSTDGWVKGDFVVAATGTTAKTVASAKAKTPTKAVAKVKEPAGKGAAALIDTAYSFIGVRYVYGGTSRSGIDCSAFVGSVMRKHGVSLPRTAAEQSRTGRYVSKSELRAGDLIFFRTGRSSRINHVALYIGGGKIIHASSGRGMVRIDDFSKSYFQRNYATSRRLGNFGTSKTDFASSTYTNPFKDDPDIVITEEILDEPERTRSTGTDEVGG